MIVLVLYVNKILISGRVIVYNLKTSISEAISRFQNVVLEIIMEH